MLLKPLGNVWQGAGQHPAALGRSTSIPINALMAGCVKRAGGAQGWGWEGGLCGCVCGRVAVF